MKTQQTTANQNDNLAARTARPAVATLLLTLLLAFAGLAQAQNWSGTWVNAQGYEAYISHHGKTLGISNWGGPTDPRLRGRGVAQGGPRVYKGTWENQRDNIYNRGTWVITFINSYTYHCSLKGHAYINGKVYPISGSGYAYRLSAINTNIMGTWNTQWGQLTLSGNNNNIKATWKNPKGLSRITSARYNPVTRLLDFTFYQDWSKLRGVGQLKLSNDGKMLDGRWKINDHNHGGWRMTRR